ncbi:FecCD family ABC transporter permease [Bacillus sp. Hm123]|uniref:FecCD family ABC transporter permease n=1 Tax=Bacillus sp. Hm123 TaxID=3450745 RepID=UPI003F41D28C
MNKIIHEKVVIYPWRAISMMLISLLLLVISSVISIGTGAIEIPFQTVIEAIFQMDKAVTEHHIVWDLRLPRVIGAIFVGICFAVSGAIMQGVTHNPLADSGLLGINAGSGFFIAIIFAYSPVVSFSMLLGASFIGAALGILLVYGLSSLALGGLTPMRLILAGAAMTALLTALSEGIAMYFNIGQSLAFWFAGTISTAKWEQLDIFIPWVVGALFITMFISKQLTLLSLGDEMAITLGVNINLIRILTMLAVLILAGAAVSIVGAVGFVGLIIPHITRMLIGNDYRWLIPTSAINGALLVVLADLAARTLSPPHEIPIGALIAILGVPFFLYLARKEDMEYD